MCNLKVVAASRTTKVRGARKGEVNSYTHKKNPENNGLMVLMEKHITTTNIAGHMGMTQVTCIHWQHANEQDFAQ